MAPDQLFLQLLADQRRQVHLSLCEDALASWIDYVQKKPASLRYRDSVVGMRHTVDSTLPADALHCARAGVDLAEIGNRYLEPITALQDGDLSFPDPIEYAYYAVYNCYRKHVRGDDISDWLIVNQALSIHDPGEAASRLMHAIANITPATRGNTDDVEPMG
ncbi:hypothetical protein ACIP5Y_26395 [Nocardia sp. NPDC088792]|uniref:hypothetical protein n=1 Tax=Nocardia sp. NPDC088792 TaxID=3364332 RepID=UPI00382107CE